MCATLCPHGSHNIGLNSRAYGNDQERNGKNLCAVVCFNLAVCPNCVWECESKSCAKLCLENGALGFAVRAWARVQNLEVIGLILVVMREQHLCYELSACPRPANVVPKNAATSSPQSSNPA